MSTYVERNFRVRGAIASLFSPPTGTTLENIANIEVQIWHQAPFESILLNKGLTDANGEFIIDIEVDSPVSYVVDGKIQDVFIKAFYNGEELTPYSNNLLNGLVAYWKLDGDSNDVINSHNGADTSVVYSEANGKINDGAGFNGTTSRILVPDSDDWNMGAGEFAFSMWVKRADMGRRAFFGKINSSGIDATASFGFEFDASDFLTAWFGTGSLISITSTSAITDSNWHHIVFTRKANTLYLYLDNVEQSTYDVTAQTMHNESNHLGIGAWGDYTTVLFSGAIDEVAIWKGRGLNEEEINVLYNEDSGLQYPF